MKKFILLTILLGVSAGFAFAESGIAVIKPTGAEQEAKGFVRFTETDKGLMINAEIEAPKGDHGFHIHTYGSCEDMGKAAGGHYNPGEVDHGFLPKDTVSHAHAGDLGNITANAEGKASLQLIIENVSLSGGPYAVGGRAVIVHASGDDFGQPTGNAGGRIGCGVIQITGK